MTVTVARGPLRFLYFPVPKAVAYAYVIGMVALYTLVRVHTPTAILPDAGLDDTLFMVLGQYLAEGKWLGPYSQYTLVKGPGYPAFLALSFWLGISSTLATALLHCGAITFLVIVCHRFIKSYLLSALLLALLLWHPVSLSLYLLRVIREEIYYAQVLFFLAAAVGALFFAKDLKQRLWFAALAGAVLGWFWLTREEGIWLLPAICVLVGAAWLSSRKLSERRQFILTVAMGVLVFTGTQVAFRTKNLIVYGSFVGVDFKEKNYQRALAAIHSIRTGGNEPAISITTKAREYVYAVSPSFALLKDYFIASNDGWAVHSCSVLHASCNEMGTGWFIYALRGAAASKGFYATPEKASVFFGRLADEIETACKKGQLECRPQLLGEVPQLEWAQVKANFLPHIIAAYNLLPFLNPPVQIRPSGDNEALLAARLRYLNYPLHTRPVDTPLIAYRLDGWYRNSGSDWFSASVRTVDGSISGVVRLTRKASPDIQAAFKDPQASHQRFTLETVCVDECVLQIQTSNGTKVERKLGELTHGAYGFQAEGFGQLHLDVATAVGNYAYIPTEAEEIVRRFREFIMTKYQYVSVPVLLIGSFAFLLASLRLRQAMFNVCYIVALSTWVLVLSRLAVLITMGVTVSVNTTMVVNPYYGAPVFFCLMCGAVLSIAAALQVYGAALAKRVNGLLTSDDPVIVTEVPIG